MAQDDSGLRRDGNGTANKAIDVSRDGTASNLRKYVRLIFGRLHVFQFANLKRRIRVTVLNGLGVVDVHFSLRG